MQHCGSRTGLCVCCVLQLLSFPSSWRGSIVVLPPGKYTRQSHGSGSSSSSKVLWQYPWSAAALLRMEGTATAP